MASYVEDSAVQQAEEMTEEIEEPMDIGDDTKSVLINLKILQVIKDAQQKHGLRHGDYQRYRSYCTRRIERVRKSLKLVQGTKHRFAPKKVTEHILATAAGDVRYLYIPLMETERAWAYGMQLRQEANTEPRKRFHLMARFRKAVKHATALEALCAISALCDARSKLEAQAYAAFMRATLKFEMQEWKTAMEFYHTAQTIYEKLSSALNEEERTIYEQRVADMTPNMRYCAYNVGDQSAMEDLKKMRLEGRVAGMEDLDQLIAQTRSSQSGTLSEVTWLGRTVPVRNETVRLFLLQAQETETEVSQAGSVQMKIDIYERLLIDCKEALQSLRDDLKVDQASKGGRGAVDTGISGGGPVSTLQFLLSYVMYVRQKATVARNLLIIESLRATLTPTASPTKSAVAPSGINDDKQSVKAQDLIRPYEIIIQNLSEMLTLPGVEMGSTFYESIQAELIMYKAHRTYYVCQALTAISKFAEAIALYQRALEYCQQAKSSSHIDKKHQDSLKELEMLIEGQKYAVHAQSILASATGATPTDPKKTKELRYLTERLDEYVEDASLLSKEPRLVPLPPEFEAVPCKPLFFDLALNHVTLPDLSDVVQGGRKGAAGGAGISGLVRGWLGGWKK